MPSTSPVPRQRPSGIGSARPESRPMPHSEPSSTLSVLVVDDFPDGLELVAEYLAFRGFAVHVAAGGAEAIEIARKVKPEIMLMDLSMPGIDGWKAAKILKTDPDTQAIC